MNEKKNAILTISVICAIFFLFTIADLVKQDRTYSETEKRLLAQCPKLSGEAVLSGEFMDAYEEYVTDQFVNRDKWIGIKTRTDILLQKKDINGVYLGKDDYLLQRHDPEDYPAQLEEERIADLQRLVQKWDAMVMLVPTADNIITDKLPDNAVYYDQTSFLCKVREAVGEEHYIDAYSALKAHSGEDIYYRTDHHWTSLGAYYGFLAWAESVDRFPYPFDVNGQVTASESFLGSLHSYVNISVKPDRLQYFSETTLRPVTVTYDLKKTTDTLYEEKYIGTKNEYGFFLDDNHAFIEINTDYKNGRTLFVIKDSYANSMIPLLTTHYETIYVLDLRYFNGKLFDFMESCEPEKGMDVLVLYNCIHFLEEFQYR